MYYLVVVFCIIVETVFSKKHTVSTLVHTQNIVQKYELFLTPKKYSYFYFTKHLALHWQTDRTSLYILATPKCATLDIAQMNLALWLAHRTYSDTKNRIFNFAIFRAVRGCEHAELKDKPLIIPLICSN